MLPREIIQIIICFRPSRKWFVLNKLFYSLAKKAIDPSVNENAAIINATYYENSLAVKSLLQDPRVDPSVHNQFAINCAVGSGHLEIVRLLLQSPRVNPHVRHSSGRLPIEVACERGYLEIIKLLLQHPRVDPNDYGIELIFNAVMRHNLEVVKILMEDKRLKVCRNSIRCAIVKGHYEMLKLLLADVMVDLASDSKYLLQNAIYRDYYEIVKLLVQHPSANRQFAFDYAVALENVRIQKLLLEDPRVVDTRIVQIN